VNWYTLLAYILTYTNNHWIFPDLLGRLQTQKSPQGFQLAGFQDFSGQFWYRRERILVELAGVEPASEITTPSALHA